MRFKIGLLEGRECLSKDLLKICGTNILGIANVKASKVPGTAGRTVDQEKNVLMLEVG